MSGPLSLIQVFSQVLSSLEQHKIPYMVVGSVASMTYGEPRLTKDMDLVIDLEPEQLKTVAGLFPDPEYYCPSMDYLADEFLRRGQFNVLHLASGLKVDFVLRKQTPHSIAEFARRRRIELWPSFEVFVASPEDVIIKKLEYFRSGGSTKHLLDVRGILAGTPIDADYLKSWVERLGLEDEYTKARNS